MSAGAKKTFEKLLRDYGDTVTLKTSDGSQTVRAFFRPVTQNAARNMKTAFAALGELPPGQLLYLGPVSAPVARGDRVRWQEEWFDFWRVETVCIGAEPLYYWGLAARGGEEDPWNC